MTCLSERLGGDDQAGYDPNYSRDEVLLANYDISQQQTGQPTSNAARLIGLAIHWQIGFRIAVEISFAARAAEIIGCATVFGFVNRGIFVYFHSTYWVN